MKTIRRWRRTIARRAAAHGESGQALAEIAIALPLLLLMLIGIWEFARAYQIQQVVVNAAREGARVMVLPQAENDADSAIDVAQFYLQAGSINNGNVTTSGADSDGDGIIEETGDAVTVRVEVPYSFVLLGPVIRLVTGNSGGPGDITLSSQATMRHE